MIDRWRQRLNPVFLFVGYRWLAWLSAGLALTLPGYAIDSLPKHASLLLVVLLVTLVITPQAMNYLRLMQRRPLLLILDVLLGWLVVTLSGGAFLPFGPYALGSLIAPALLFGWQGALIGGISVGVLNLISSSILAVADPAGIQAGVPLLFALGWAALAAWQRMPMERLSGKHLRQLNPSASPATLRHPTLP
ncbi:MAG: ATP-binding protein, partial [Chloroflexus sp.]|nr:ATP-binding protein [Chloroflexus sp.]